MKQISAALVKAQRAFSPALKTSTNPHFKSKYADLSACVEAVIDALNTQGIFLMQQSHEHPDGVVIETTFIHESGEQISSGKVFVPAAKKDAQGFGSAMTYARRYSLMAACGIAPEDDDGNAARAPEQKKPESSKSVAKATLEEYNPEQQQYLKQLAMEVLSHLPDELAMFHAYEKTKKTLDSDEQVAWWAFFDSKSRAALKRAKSAETPAAQ